MSEDSGLIDIEKLDRWIRGQGLKTDEELKLQRIQDGRSNEMFFVECGQQHWVLRRPSGIAWEKTEKGLCREFRLLDAIKDTGVPIPRAVALCEDRSVLGAVFYLMEKIDGFTPAYKLPEEFVASAELRQQTVRALLEAAAALHSLDWRALGLEDFGKIDNFHERQVGRWAAQLDGYQGRELTGIKDIGNWLEKNLPSRWTPTIMHGDYHALNMMMAPELPPKMAGIIDWETSTIGDPFIDIVGFLDIWFDTNKQYSWPDYEDLVDYYLSLVKHRPENFTYYQALYHYRMAVLLEGIYQRSFNDETRETQHAVGERALIAVERGLKAIH